MPSYGAAPARSRPSLLGHAGGRCQDQFDPSEGCTAPRRGGRGGMQSGSLSRRGAVAGPLAGSILEALDLLFGQNNYQDPYCADGGLHSTGRRPKRRDGIYPTSV